MIKDSSLSLSGNDKALLFWASFLALTAAGVGFVFRVMIPDMWESHFQITAARAGELTGAALWPIAITMILFSLLVDKIGYKASMFFALALQAISVVLTIRATTFHSMWWASFFAGLGHGVVEAVINPLCASIYRDQKSKMLNILHASWPAGIVLGGAAWMLLIGAGDLNPQPGTWTQVKWMFWLMLIPVVAYGLLFLACHRFPVDERVEAEIPMKEMLREWGGLGAFLASTFLFYELVNQLGLDKQIARLPLGDNGQLIVCLALGALVGTVVGFSVGSPGKILFFVLCLIMIPLAAAELATDAWIQTLMKPIMGTEAAGWAIVASAGIMMSLRFFAGIPLRVLSPPQLLFMSSVFSIIGLYAMSSTAGAWIFAAFVLYAVGQTFYWPTMLGLVAEQFPRGGAMTLNTVSAMGLLTVGIFGAPFLGAVQDHYNTQTIARVEPQLFATARDTGQKFVDTTNPDKPEEMPLYESKNFFGVRYDSVNTEEFLKVVGGAEPAQAPDETRSEALKDELMSTSRSSLKVAAVLPLVMAVAFLLIIIYFALRGGYRPVLLAGKKKGDETAIDQPAATP